MRLVTRLWLWGAAVPLAVVLVVLAGASLVFRGVLESSVDRALLSQAAAESVSLFDAPDGHPHLHVEKSPLAREVRPFVPTTWLYGPNEMLVGAYPQEASHLLGGAPVAPSPGEMGTLETREGVGGVRLRVYSLQVRARDGSPYVLQLAASLAPVDEAVRVFVLTALGIAVLLGLVLLSLQGWQARQLSGRLLHIRRQMAELREGRLLPAPGTREPRDEITEVRLALEDTAGRLTEARAAQERLVARAAHELRTPLALMRTTLDLALRRERPAEALREALEETRREVDRLTQVAATLLELSAPGTGALPPEALPVGDVREVVEEAVAAARAEALRRRVRLVVEGPSCAPAPMDAQALRRALDNLLANALRYAPADSAVRVHLGARGGGGWRLAVQDEGRGIAPARREDIFQPFVRLESDGEGAGLGLSLVREVARRHGGSAYVAESAVGARLVLELPQVPGRPA